MARKRSLAAAVMALPNALSQAVTSTLPPGALDELSYQEALEIGLALETAARAIAGILAKKGAPANG